jgi:hypothetical protein
MPTNQSRSRGQVAEDSSARFASAPGSRPSDEEARMLPTPNDSENWFELLMLCLKLVELLIRLALRFWRGI